MEDNKTARLFARACELVGDERARYLDQICDGDEDLRRRLLALLEADEEPLSSLDQGARLPRDL